MKIGLVLEGGGMRGVYTAGVLDVFLDEKIDFKYIIGVSAGACHAASFISKQRGRGFATNTDYLKDKRYLSFSNYFKTKSVFGMDFIFNEIPNKLNKFDFETFRKSKVDFRIVATDVNTGKPFYFNKDNLCDDFKVLQASVSIPLFASIVSHNDGEYLDGGASDPIPIRKAIEDGCDKVIVISTRDRAYTKKKEKGRVLYKRAFRKYPNMIKALDERHSKYNSTLEYMKELESKGRCLVISPSIQLKNSRFEKNKEKLKIIYNLGMEDAKNNLSEIRKFIKK